MQLDNIELTVGHTVYDLAVGPGTVTDVTDTTVTVQFPSGWRAAYDALGAGVYGNRTLYPLLPIFVATFGDSRDQVLHDVISSLYESLKVI
jgi:hypothetical protein